MHRTQSLSPDRPENRVVYYIPHSDFRIQLSPAKAGSGELFGRQRSGEPDRTAKGQAQKIWDLGFWIWDFRNGTA